MDPPPNASGQAAGPAPVLPAGSILPPTNLASVAGAAPVNLRSGRGPRIVITLHSPDCADCVHYIRMHLAREIASIAEWGGHVVIVIPAEVNDAGALSQMIFDGVQLLADAEGRIATGRATVMVADEWGEVFFSEDAGEAHRFPSPRELAGWVRFIAIQCEECERPEGAWKSV